MTPPVDRLVQEALAKSGVLWLTSEAGSAPVWYAHVESRAYVVSGPGEQFCPDHRGRVEVVTRSKDTRARLASFTAQAEVLSETDEDWGEATAALKAGRLNSPTGDVVERWRNECTILRLSPDLSTMVVRGEALAGPASSAAAEDTEPAGAVAAAAADPDLVATPGGATTADAASSKQSSDATATHVRSAAEGSTRVDASSEEPTSSGE